LAVGLALLAPQSVGTGEFVVGVKKTVGIEVNGHLTVWKKNIEFCFEFLF
jgi:hypothetical protein